MVGHAHVEQPMHDIGPNATAMLCQERKGKFNSPPWALDHGVVFRLGPEPKNRADVRPPCEKIYLPRAVDGSRVDDPPSV